MSRLAIFLYLLSCTSCANTVESTYFYGARDGAIISVPEGPEVPIQKNDILSISISSLNADASAIFNTPNTFNIVSTTSSGNSTQSSGYLVNSEGEIQLPILGKFQAAGLTKLQLKDEITRSILSKKLLLDPIVNIRYLNFEVTIIGEVGHPAVITVPNEKMSLLKALGLAGDITIYGKKDNVMLIREIDGKKFVKHINLNSPDFLTSSYYYLRPNDVIYVESNKDKKASASRSWQLMPVVLSALSIIVIIVDRLLD